MKKNYPKFAKEITDRHNLYKYIDIILDYWTENPTTLGHGFSHVLKVAVEAYELGELNGYGKPENLFIGSLFHDIYRPAEGKDGEEDQTRGASIVKELFTKEKVPDNITKMIMSSILSHDNWAGRKDANVFDIIVSIGDKATHQELIYYYVWASNKYAEDKGGEIKYKNHLEVLYGFVKYQQRAWDIFIKHPIRGIERAVEAYIEGYRKVSDNYKKDRKGKNFQNYLKNQAEEYRKEERKYLELYGRDDRSIKRIMARCF